MWVETRKAQYPTVDWDLRARKNAFQGHFRWFGWRLRGIRRPSGFGGLMWGFDRRWIVASESVFRLRLSSHIRALTSV